MRLERITLDNFRNYTKTTFNLHELTVVIAPNGAGKTNLLEAIYLLATGTSPRAGVTEELVHWGSEVATVSGIVESQEERTELAVVLTRGVVMGKPTQKRRYLLDGVAKTREKFTDQLAAIWFRPEDMRLVEGSPSRRRSFLDETLAMVHPDYTRALKVYEASLKRRNRVLDAIREGTAKRTELSYWDQSVIKNGNILTDFRRDYLAYLSEQPSSFGRYRLDYDASTISEARLREHASAEVAMGYTLVGPHKDDFAISEYRENGNDPWKNLMVYGSRGEQRLGVLFLKLSTLKYVEEKMGVKPILLLDDIFSELDEPHRQEVVKMTEGRQTIVTTAEEEAAELFGGRGEVLKL